MAIAHVQGGHAEGGTTSQAFSFGSNNTSGNLIVVVIDANVNTGTLGVTDSKGNTYASAVGPTLPLSGTKMQQMFYSMNIAAGANTVTVTTTNGSNGYLQADVHEFSGLATTSALGSVVSDNANHTGDFGPGTLSNAAGSLVVASGIDTGGGLTQAASGTYTTTAQATSSILIMYNTSAGANSAPLFNVGFLDNTGSLAAEFKVPGGGGGTPLKLNSSLSGLGSSGPFFHDRLA